MTRDKAKPTSFRLSPDAVEHLRKLAALNDRPMASYLERLILAQPLQDVEHVLPKPKPAEIPQALRAKVAAIVQPRQPEPEDDYDPDSERTVEPDPDYLASTRQPRR